MTLTPIGLLSLPSFRSLARSIKSILRKNDYSIPRTRKKKLRSSSSHALRLFELKDNRKGIYILKASEERLSIRLTMNFQGSDVARVLFARLPHRKRDTPGRNERQPIINLRFPGSVKSNIGGGGFWSCSHRQTIRQTSLMNRRFRVNTKFRQVFAASRLYQEKARSIPPDHVFLSPSLSLYIYIYRYTQPLLGHFFSRISNVATPR